MDFSKTYDVFTSSDDYAGRFDGKVGEWFLRVQEQATLRMIAPYGNATVLDVGGGHGQLTRGLLGSGCRVTVLSSSEECRARIREFVDTGEIDFHVSDLTHMPYPDRWFGIVISYRLMAHMTCWQDFLRELARVANHAVLFDYPEVRSINFIAPYLYGIKKRMEPNTRRFRCLRMRELEEVLGETGFHVTERFPQYLLPMVLHRRANRVGLSRAAEGAFRSVGLTGLFGSPVIVKAERVR